MSPAATQLNPEAEAHRPSGHSEPVVCCVLGLDAHAGYYGRHKVGLVDFSVHHGKTLRFALAPCYLPRLIAALQRTERQLALCPLPDKSPEVIDAEIPRPRPRLSHCDGHVKQLPVIEWRGGKRAPAVEADEVVEHAEFVETAATAARLRAAGSATDAQIDAAWERYTTSDVSLTVLARELGYSGPGPLHYRFGSRFGADVMKRVGRIHATSRNNLCPTPAARSAYIRARCAEFIGTPAPLTKPSGHLL